MAQGGRSGLQRWRVPLGFLVVLSFLLLSSPTWSLIAIGLSITLAGLALRGWASGHLRKNAELAVTGPYAYTRNPLYFGSLLMTLGAAVSGGSAWLAAGLLSSFLLVYYPVMRSEADHMNGLFKGEYAKWAAQVPLFIPRLTPYRAGYHRCFERGLYVQHREYQAFIGVALIFAVLALKAGGYVRLGG